MKNLIKILGIIVIGMVIGFGMVNCDDDSETSGGGSSGAGCNNKNNCFANNTGGSFCSLDSCAVSQKPLGPSTCNCN